MFWCQENCPSENCPPSPPRKLPSENWPRENYPLWIFPYESSPCENYPPEICSPENCTLWKSPPLRKLPPLAPTHTYKSYQNYKIFGLEESCATQHPYQNNQGPLWYSDDRAENTGIRYFLYRIKKVQKLNESENRQMAFTCQLYKSRRTKTRQSNYKIWQICETTK